MQVELWQYLTDLFGLSLEEWQYATDKPFVQIADARTAYGNRPIGQSQASRFTIAIAIPGSGIDRLSPS
jgi:hypothetical protein